MAKSGATSKDAKANKASGAGTKAKVDAPKAKADTPKGKNEGAILEVLLKEFKFNNTQGLKNEELAKKSGGNKTSDWFCKAIKILRDEKHFIEKATEGYVLTEAGAEFMGFKKTDLSKLGTNEELHQYIKEQLDPKWKGAQIFDLLLEHGPQTRKQLAEKVGVNDRSHSFSYGLKEIKATEYVTTMEGTKGSSKMVTLTDKAYVTKSAVGEKGTLPQSKDTHAPKAPKTPTAAATTETAVESTAKSEGITVVCVQEGSKIRVRPESGKYHTDWNIQFPKNLRQAGIRFVVDELHESKKGGFYCARGDIRRLD